MRHAVKIFILAVMITLAVGAGGIGWLFWRSQPVYAGHVAMPGLAATVRVYRDEHGVPHIFADNMNDAARALGYIHADERLFQMEMQRRTGAGRLSEILGADMLDVDKFTRTMGFYRLAQQTYQALSPEAQKLFDAYAEGVNQWLTTHRDALPPEFVILRLTPEPWTPADSLVWAKLMALQLSGNYKEEILRARLAQKLSPEQLQMMFAPPPANAPITTLPGLTKTGALIVIPTERGMTKLEQSLFRRGNLQPRSSPLEGEDRWGVDSTRTKLSSRGENPTPDPALKGRRTLAATGRDNNNALEKLGAITSLGHAASNEWVISGARTESGKPILANDPHLGLEAPILWYLARIQTPGLSLEGATVPGLPIVLLGQNEHIAWGLTTTGSDVEDLFIETVDLQNPDQYLTPGGAQPFEMRHETIRVKGAPDIDLKIRATRHGPVLSDIDPSLTELAGTNKVMALAFTALGDHDTTPEALMRINRATNWQEFMGALQLYQAPPQNIVYADTEGNIGFVAAGIVPIRKSGKGLVPADGASGDYDWTGMIPFERWPQLYNPPAGFAFNANNAIVAADAADAADYYGEDWEEPFRAERLQQFFDTTGKHNLDISAQMQADTLSLAARQLLPILLNQKFSGARETQALEMLRHWGGTMDKDRPEPLIFEAWLYEMHKLLLTDKTGDALKALGPFDARALLAILAGGPGWCATPQQPAANCDDAVEQAFEDALILLTERDGADMSKWRWGDEQITMLRHKFYSHVPVFDKLTELDVPSSGDFYTLDRGGSSVTDPTHPFARTHGGGFRGIYDLSDPAKSRFMIATGESGHILTKHYGDLVEPWNNVQSFTLTGTENELKARGLPELEMAPAK